MLVLNTDLVQNGILTPRDWEYRTQKDEKHRSSIQEQFDEIISFIKEETYDKGEDVFFKLKTSWIKTHFEFAETNDIATLSFCLKNDPHIICRNDDTATENLSKNRPQWYRWVPEEEKASMGFDAVAFKNVSDDILCVLKTDFDNYQSSPSAILAVIDRLVFEGANKGWIAFSPLRLSGRSGIPIHIIQTVLDDLMKNNYIQIDKVSEIEGYKGRKPSNITLTFDEETRKRRIEELEKEVVLYIPEKKERMKRTSRNEAISELDEVIRKKLEKENKKAEKQKIVAINDSFSISNDWKDPEKSFSQKNNEMAYEKQLMYLYENCQIEISKFSELSKRVMQQMFRDAKRESIENGKHMADMTQKVLDNELLIENQNKEIARLQNILEQERAIQKEFSIAVVEEMTNFQGNLMSVIEEFSRKPVYVVNSPAEINKFKMKVFNLAADLSNSLQNWNSREKKIPNLIK